MQALATRNRQYFLRCIVSALLSLFVTAQALAWPTVFATGTTLYNPERSSAGYTLFAPVGKKPDGSSTVFLINMSGAVVQQWSVPLFALHARLLPNGNLLFLGQSEKEPAGRPGLGKFWMGGAAGTILELDWDGKTVFQHEDLNMHHDAVRLPNGHTLYLAWERVPAVLQRKIRGGIKGSEFSDGVMFNDYLIEIDARGKTVWTWRANAHLDPDIDIIGPFYKREEWCHGNSLAVLANGNIALTSRALDSIMIIEKKSGKIIFRRGNTAYLDKKTGRIEYRNGPDFMGGPHGAEVIAAGLPGAGHLLCYDNGLYNFASRAVEIDGATSKLVWQSSQPGMGRKHFSDIMGSSQRLPNGNTLICDGANGRFFEETAQHGLVWEYQNPYSTDPLLQGAVLKAYRYVPDYCPQFKALPPATGAAILPTGSAQVGAATDQPKGATSNTGAAPSRYWHPLSFAIGAVVTAALMAVAALLRRRRRIK